MKIVRYVERIFIALSVLLNVLLGGYSNQTFSARNWDWKRRGYPNLVWLIDFVIFWESNHCLVCWVYWSVRKDIA